jgi:hypothetical protein
MEYMRFDPERLCRRFQSNTRITSIQFRSLDIVSTYLNITPVIEFIQSLEDQSLKNIWNAITGRWNRIHTELSEHSVYQKSVYRDQTYSQIHVTFDHARFEELLDDFIQDDIMKALFVLQSMMNYVFPK